MVVPLVVLAVLSVIGGFVGMPFQEGGHALARWLAPVFAAEGGHAVAEAHLSVNTEWVLIFVSVAVAALGIFLALRAYGRPEAAETDPLEARAPAVHRALLNKYWVDELYDTIVVRPVKRLSDGLWTFWDVKVVDGTVNGVAYVMEGVSALLRVFQNGFVGTYALFITLGVAALIAHFLRR
jgi:NADH-quinone oxidoreductase subunit L